MSKNKHKHKGKSVLIQTDYQGATYRACARTHWRSAVKAGKWTVTVSRYEGKEPEGEYRTPDLGIYLDSQWTRRFGFASTGVPGPFAIPYPYVYVVWADRAALHEETFDTLVSWACDQVRAGMSVDIGCYGAHGRTGTLLAGIIARLESVSAKEAIRLVRTRHCPEAIETRGQENMIYALLGETPPPEPQKPVLGGAQKSDTFCTCGHTKAIHHAGGCNACEREGRGWPCIGYDGQAVGYDPTWDTDVCACSHPRGDHKYTHEVDGKIESRTACCHVLERCKCMGFQFKSFGKGVKA